MLLIDYGNTNVILVPTSYLTQITGTIYSLPTNAFRLDLKASEASEVGIVFPDTNIHATEVTVSTTTFARTMSIINPYSVEFQDGQYTVILQGSNNNIFDVVNNILVQNQVQIIPTNSAGLIVGNSSGGSSLTPAQEATLNKILNILEGDVIPEPNTFSILHKLTKDILVQKDANEVNDLTQLTEPE